VAGRNKKGSDFHRSPSSFSEYRSGQPIQFARIRSPRSQPKPKAG